MIQLIVKLVLVFVNLQLAQSSGKQSTS